MIYLTKKSGSMDYIPNAKFVELGQRQKEENYQYIVTNKENPSFYKIEAPNGAIRHY